jgi:hypothetical protein
MGEGRNVLLRRTSPLAVAAVLVLLAPATGHASSFSPDPPPGASELRPDPAPSSSAGSQLQLPAPARTVVVPPAAPVRAVTTPATVQRRPVRTTSPAGSRRPAARTRPHTDRLALPTLELPPVVVPAFVSTQLRPRSPAGLAALALALAALTAGSGAGLVRAWSRR